jgi:signal transduction histidine kinase
MRCHLNIAAKHHYSLLLQFGRAFCAVLILFGVAFIHCQAQTQVQKPSASDQSVIDSLESVLAVSGEAQRVAVLNELTIEHFYVSLEKASAFQREALALAQKLQDRIGIATALLNGAFVQRLSGDYQGALEPSTEALKLLRQLGDNHGIARALYQLGLVQQARSDYLQSRSYYLQSLAVSEATGDLFQTARTYNAISEDYFGQGDLEKALDYAFRSLELHRKHFDKRWLALQMDNVGYLYEKSGNAERALDYYMQAYALLTSIGAKGQHRLANSCKNLANANCALKRYDEALKWAQRGVQMTVYEKHISLNGERGNYKALADVYEAMGNIDAALEWNKRIFTLSAMPSYYTVGLCRSVVQLYVKRGDCAHAREYATKAWNIAVGLENPRVLESASLLMSQALSLCGHYAEAYTYQVRYQALHDSLTSVEKSKQIARMQAMYELERQREENERLRKENTLQESVISRQTIAVIGVASLLALALILALLFYRANEQKKLVNGQLQDASNELDAALRDLKETQARLVQSERMNTTGMLTAGVMHEINNPNAAVIAALYDAKKRLERLKEFFFSLLDESSKFSRKAVRFTELSDDAQHTLDIASKGAERIRHIVGNLQQFSKHQRSGSYSGVLAEELASTIEIFRYQFKDITLTVDVAANIPIAGNIGELNQVFLNLLVNAAQAGATAISITSNITSEGASEKKRVALRISDNGRGMSASVKAHIFEPFFSTKGGGNSGLGLSISKQILERHGGALHVESEPDKGTTFIVELFMEV